MIRVRNPLFSHALSFALLLTSCFVASTAAGDGGAKDCNPASSAAPLATETASAGAWANLTNRAGSIRATSNHMLSSAIETARSDQSVQRIVFKSIPELSKKTTDDDQMCARLEQTTRQKPLKFDDKRFATVDDLTDWIMDFTQGEGADGKSLYNQCPGKCSPQYTWWIYPEKTELLVKARVICGLPRDRDSNKYQLSIELAPACPVAQSQ
jgi:hypothetical protein